MLHFSFLAALIISHPAIEDLGRHQGCWAVVRFEREGTITTAEVLSSIERRVEGDHIVWRRDGKNFAGTTFVIDVSQTPKAIDLFPDGGPSRGQAVFGIYRFGSDGTLTMCVADVGQERPRQFSSEPGSKQNLQVFRPASREPKGQAP
jgi:uncharacterized protein (TIGR03067 family)